MFTNSTPSLTTPRFTLTFQGGRRKVRIELVKPSDDTTSEFVDFYYINQSSGYDAGADIFAKENNFYVNIGSSPSKIKLERSDSLLHQHSPPELLLPAVRSPVIQSPNIPKITFNNNNSNNSNNNSNNSNNNSANPVFEELNIRHNDEEDHFKLMDNSDMDSLICFNKTIENLSGKIESFSLSDAIDTSLNMENEDFLESRKLQDYQETRRSSIKRTRMTAALESGSDVVQPKLSSLFPPASASYDQTSSSLHTPGNSSELFQQNISKYLTNCPKIND